MLGRWKIFVTALAGLFVMAAAGAVQAQCCSPPPPCCSPPPPPPPPSGGPCCGGGGHTIVVPGVNVSVHSTAIAVSNASAYAGAGSSAGGVVYLGGGGGWYVDQQAPSMIGNLNVDTGDVRRAAYEATRRSSRRVVIQAVCIDDRAIPHPASQVRPGQDVEDSYDGELWRCIAGTRMQATIADYVDRISFDGGETLACAKGEALYHSPGGDVSCRPQRPARDCNERSLLRRYGAGVKILTMVRTETYTAYREEQSSSSSSSSSSMSIMLDGGVGGLVR
jgi:hypothetical protein